LSFPLYTDPVLFAGLKAGDYYLAVSSADNLPIGDLQPGSQGVFDPNVSHWGTRGDTTGDYVLDLQLVADGEAPRVVHCSLDDEAQLDAAPTAFTLDFSETVNLTELANAAFGTSSTTELDSIFVRGSDGMDYHPRLVSYDAATGR